MSAETPLRTVTVGCCVCGATGGATVGRGWDFEYDTTREELSFVRCGCGHVYLSPRPAPEELGRIYPSNYYAYDIEQRTSSLALRVKNWLDTRKVRRILLELPADRRASARCLDVGSGDGRVLDLLAAAGLPKEQLHGVEIDRSAYERMQAKGYGGWHGRAEALELPAGSFDLITAFQVLEHMEDPAAVLERLGTLLAPGGVLVVETPNVRSLDARLFRRRYWGGYHFPRHWNLFHRSSISRLSARAGLEPARTETFVCAVFWIYPAHHLLRELGLPRPVYRLFWPLSNPLLLAVATAVDVLLAPLGLSSNLRAVLRKPPREPDGAS